MGSILTIDRTRVLDWSLVSVSSKDSFSLVGNDPLAETLTQFDVSRLRLKKILEISGQAERVNETIKKSLLDLKNRGYIFLDGYACRALLEQTKLFPADWAKFADSDSFSPNHGAIRFDGTWFKNKQTSEEVVLAPFVSRGQWTAGFNPRFYSQSEIRKIEKYEDLLLIQYTAVLAPIN